jgi:hypothetical protein
MTPVQEPSDHLAIPVPDSGLQRTTDWQPEDEGNQPVQPLNRSTAFQQPKAETQVPEPPSNAPLPLAPAIQQPDFPAQAMPTPVVTTQIQAAPTLPPLAHTIAASQGPSSSYQIPASLPQATPAAASPSPGAACQAETTYLAAGQPDNEIKPPSPAEERLLRRFNVQVELPTLERLMRLETDADAHERMRQEGLNAGVTTFPRPDEPVMAGRAPGPRCDWPVQNRHAEPNYVCYCPLYFEDKNSERYGWSLGPIQPVVSGGIFYADLATLPLKLAFFPWYHDDCSAGQCLPGDPVPYLLYPPAYRLWYEMSRHPLVKQVANLEDSGNSH